MAVFESKGKDERGVTAVEVAVGDPGPGEGSPAAEGDLAPGDGHRGRPQRFDRLAHGVEDAPGVTIAGEEVIEFHWSYGWAPSVEFNCLTTANSAPCRPISHTGWAVGKRVRSLSCRVERTA